MKAALIFLLAPSIIGPVPAGIHARKMANKPELAIKFLTVKVGFRRRQPLNLVLIFHRALPVIGLVEIGVHARQEALKLGVVAKHLIVRVAFHRQQFHSPALILQFASHCIILVGPNVRQTENKREV